MTIHRPAFAGCTTTIHHRLDIPGLREITDDSAGVCVLAFPFDAIAQVVASELLACHGVYTLCDDSSAYVGETNNGGRRLLEHAIDTAKSFANEVYFLAALDPRRFDKPSVIFLQKVLTEQAEAARFVTVLKGVAPWSVDLPGYRLATLNRLLQDGYRLMFDAGCRVFHSNHPPKAAAAEQDRALVNADESDDSGIMEIGVSTVPPGTQEYELLYTGTWALGYEHQDGFVVAAGSEIRTIVNDRVNPILNTRRGQLQAKNAFMPIAGVEDRMRLAVAVWFPSMAIAAKVVCGAHVTSKHWRPVQRPVPVILAT